MSLAGNDMLIPLILNRSIYLSAQRALLHLFQGKFMMLFLIVHVFYSSIGDQEWVTFFSCSIVRLGDLFDNRSFIVLKDIALI